MRIILVMLSLLAAGKVCAIEANDLAKIVAIQEGQIRELKEQVKLLQGFAGYSPAYGHVLFNSVANKDGTATGDQNTNLFWQIPYASRFASKGALLPDLSRNYYNGNLYMSGRALYTDVAVDLDGREFVLLSAEADGIDVSTMAFINPKKISGSQFIYDHQFAGGWSSPDADYDKDPKHCANLFGKVTQHYGSCWVYNLGADAHEPILDSNWGPHIHSGTAKGIGLKVTDREYSRVLRITRYVKSLAR